MRDGWSETALGSVLKLSNKKLGHHKEEPEIFAISKYDGVVLAQDYFDRRIASKSLDGYKVIGPGDWVYSTIHIDEGSIAVNHFPFRGVVSPMYTSMIWNSHLHDYRFFEFLLKSDGVLIRYQENAQGTVNRRRSLSWKAFSEMTFVVPPLAEQKRIVDVVSSVDAYIDALQQQAVTARTARNAVLHQLLSTGGDDWTETTLGELCELYQPETISKAQMDDAAPYIVYGANGPVGRYSKFNHEEPEVVVTCRGATCGVVNMTPPNCWITGNAMVVKPRDSRATKGFLFWALQTSVDVQATISGSAQPQITRTGLEPSRILVPPLAEQKRIVEIVSSMNDVIQLTEQSVADAKNLRSGLLSDLLSGAHEIQASYDSLLGVA